MDERIIDLIAAFSLLDPNPTISSVLMEFAEYKKGWVRYQAGPVIIHQSPWAESLPKWVIPAIYSDRAELIAQEAKHGQVGELATLTEVMAYMYPATMDAPLTYEWVQVYLYCGQTALAKHNKLPKGKTFAEVITGNDQPLQLDDYITSQFLIPLQRDIRCRVVQVAADRGVAKEGRRPKPKTLILEVPKSQATNSDQGVAVQMSLFDFGE